MSVSAQWRDYVVEQLSGLRGVTARSMFGGAGLYASGTIFGVLDNDQVFFKVDDRTRPAYVARGAGAWDPMPGHYPPSQGYYEVPADILDDRDELVAWAREAVAVGLRKAKTARKTKAARKTKTARKKTARRKTARGRTNA